MKRTILTVILLPLALSAAAQHHTVDVENPEILRHADFREPSRREIVLPCQVNGYNVYKADLHTHSVYSDGWVTPQFRVKEAWLDGLDILAITEHIEYRPFENEMKDYLDVKSKIKRLQEIRENDYFNALQIKFAYAVTCHKAQGGQWKAVFIDKCIFGDEPMTKDMLRWLYTAITRATERLYFVNFDERFFEE
mgnify:CR=1 FL=1